MTRRFHASRVRAAALVAASIVSSLCGAARAERKGQVVAIVVEGANADEVAGWLEDRVRAPDTLKEGDAFREALRARGALPLRPAGGNGARDAQMIARAHAAAGDLGVDQIILADVHKTPRATRVHVWRIEARTEEAVVDSDISLLPSASAIEETRAILAVAPLPSGPVEPPAPVAPPAAPGSWPLAATVDAAPAHDRVTTPAPAASDSSLLSAQAGLGVAMRHFSYVDRVTPSLRPYDLGAAPMATVAAVVYPLASTRTPFVRDLGIAGSYGQAFALASEDSAGDRVGTTWRSFDVGATERIALTRALQANVSAGYGGDDFQFTQNLAGGAAALPSVAYRFVRVGGDVRLRFLSAFSAFGGGSYLDVLTSGYTGQLFPRESVGGVEGHLGMSYLLAKNWEVSLNASYLRMFYSFNPVPGDASVAGGALDEQTRIVAGFSYLM
jgi:hypothetical protein